MSKLWRAYLGAIEAFCVAGIALILVVSAMQVFARYVLESSLFWSEELMRYTMLWIVALGAGVSFGRGQFLGMRMLVETLSPGLRRACDLLGAMLILIFLGFVIFYGFRLSWGTRMQSAVALNVSLFWVHVSVVAGSVLLALHVALKEFFGVSSGAVAPTEDEA
mgnify:CR=1 FL=1